MTVTDIERGLIARYLCRVFSRPDLSMRAARYVMFWLNERADGFGLPLPKPIADTLGSIYSGGFKAADFERAFQKNRKALIQMLEEAAAATQRPEPLAGNVEMLIKALGLPMPETSWRIVGLFASALRYEQVLYLSATVLECMGPHARAIAVLTGEETRTVEDLLSPGNELIGSGLVQLQEHDQLIGLNGRYTIPFRVNSNLDGTYSSFEEMRKGLLGDTLRSPVAVDDYAHVAEDRDLIRGVLEGAARIGTSGVNILLYGPPGAGKTELAKVVAEAAGLSLFAAGEDVSQEGESNRSGRLADLVFSQRLLSGQRRTALLFDEMEDVAVHLIRRGGSKVFLNRLLETNTVPTLWTSNALHDIDPALLRRMTLAIELKRPPAAQRRRIIERLLARTGLAIADADVARLAERIEATPAILENAIRAAKLAGGGADIVERAARGILRAVSGMGAPHMPVIPAFDPLLTRANQDLLQLADRVVGGSTRAFSLCLSGPPGTGKSSFSRYLAGRLGLEVLQKRASDILGPYIGQSERNIANAFEEAREAGALMIFDEADSLLLDRRDAVRTWEITQVNEMLTWMEDHPLPVCFTTNLMDRIDPASLRRFTFHVRFEFMDRIAVAHAWRVFFGRDPAPRAGLAFENLTPGDFAKARKQAEVLGIVTDTPRVIELLGEISRGKPDAKGGMGFVA